MENILRVKLVSEGIDKVSYNKEGDCAIDLRASGVWVVDLDKEKKEIEQDEYEIKPGERILIKTGIKIAIPKGHYGSIRDRSGLALKQGLHTIAGVVDENYREELGIVVVNLGTKSYKLLKNERIAQMIISKYEKVKVEYVEELDKTEREDDFGSSGRH